MAREVTRIFIKFLRIRLSFILVKLETNMETYLPSSYKSLGSQLFAGLLNLNIH